MVPYVVWRSTAEGPWKNSRVLPGDAERKYCIEGFNFFSLSYAGHGFKEEHDFHVHGNSLPRHCDSQ